MLSLLLNLDSGSAQNFKFSMPPLFMSTLRQFTQQQIEDVPNLALERAERWNNGLRLPLHNVAQNYKRGKLHLLLNASCDVRGKRYGGVFCVEASDCVDLWTAEVEPSECNRQLTVLGFPVQVVDKPEDVVKRVASVVRLYSFDDLLGSVAREYLYFSFETGRTIFVETLAADGKRNADGVAIPNLWLREKPSHVVKAGPEVIQRLASDNGESQRDFAAMVVDGFLHEHLKVFITDDWVLAFVEETGDLNLKVDDVFLGPF